MFSLDAQRAHGTNMTGNDAKHEKTESRSIQQMSIDTLFGYNDRVAQYIFYDTDIITNS